MQTHGKICALQNRWNTRKLEEETKKLTQAAERRDVKPIWGYQKLRSAQTRKHTPLRKEDGQYTQNTRNNNTMDKLDPTKLPRTARTNNTGNTTHHRNRMGPNRNKHQQKQRRASNNKANARKQQKHPTTSTRAATKHTPRPSTHTHALTTISNITSITKATGHTWNANQAIHTARNRHRNLTAKKPKSTWYRWNTRRSVQSAKKLDHALPDRNHQKNTKRGQNATRMEGRSNCPHLQKKNETYVSVKTTDPYV